jgi:hypothetical protein
VEFQVAEHVTARAGVETKNESAALASIAAPSAVSARPRSRRTYRSDLIVVAPFDRRPIDFAPTNTATKKPLQHVWREKQPEKPAFPRARNNTNRKSDAYLHDVAVEFARGATIPIGLDGAPKFFYPMRRSMQSAGKN